MPVSPEWLALVLTGAGGIVGFVLWMTKISSDTGRTLQKIDSLIDGQRVTEAKLDGHETRIVKLEVQMEGP